MYVFVVVVLVGIPGDSLPGSLKTPRVKPEVTIVGAEAESVDL